jgi:hypothetical protein
VVSLQGWVEGTVSTSASLLILTADDDEVSGWGRMSGPVHPYTLHSHRMFDPRVLSLAASYVATSCQTLVP